jgi:GntR family transcriptional regulator
VIYIINKRSSVPLYIQIKRDLIRKIKEGEFQIGESIPGENHLKNIFNVSLITVRKAIAELVNEGYLYRIQGRGTYAADRIINRPLNLMSFTEDMREKNFNVHSKLLELDVLNDEFIADKMCIPFTEPVVKIKRVRIVDNEPIALQTSYILGRILPLEEAKK